jgi:tetratricopeptide (TPR) repeat protein
MKQAFHLLAAILVSLGICAPTEACLWDYDTLAMERQRFPNALELITGHFLRHSREFYQWRVGDREQRLRETQSSDLYDDLAVAYDKLGDHDKAIAITLQKQEHFRGLYETHANLGTFYIHSGQLELGVQQIDIAISINPDAHFGREAYQKHLVNYVFSRQTDGTTNLPLGSERSGMEPAGFSSYILATQNIGDSADAGAAELSKAMKGVLGMMRFGNHDSPILLEVLGDLLLSRAHREDAKRLAARAYLKASYHAKDDATREAYRRLAKKSLSMQTVHKDTKSELSLEALELKFSDELADASSWFKVVADDEAKWIRGGENVDEVFAQKYYQEPELASPTNTWFWVFLVGALTLILLCLTWIILRRTAAARKSIAT